MGGKICHYAPWWQNPGSRVKLPGCWTQQYFTIVYVVRKQAWESHNLCVGSRDMSQCPLRAVPSRRGDSHHLSTRHSEASQCPLKAALMQNRVIYPQFWVQQYVTIPSVGWTHARVRSFNWWTEKNVTIKPAGRLRDEINDPTHILVLGIGG